MDEEELALVGEFLHLITAFLAPGLGGYREIVEHLFQEAATLFGNLGAFRGGDKLRPDWEHAVHRALTTSGKAVTFTAASMIAGTLFWTFSKIRFDSEMGLLLALWMGISFMGSMTLLPVSVLTFKPKFVILEAQRIAREEARRARLLQKAQGR
jgi:hypothetical protein